MGRHLDDFHPAGQALGNRPQQRRRTGPGDNEPALLGAALVNRDAQRGEDRGQNLDLVDGDAGRIEPEERVRIARNDGLVSPAFEVKRFQP